MAELECTVPKMLLGSEDQVWDVNRKNKHSIVLARHYQLSFLDFNKLEDK